MNSTLRPFRFISSEEPPRRLTLTPPAKRVVREAPRSNPARATVRLDPAAPFHWGQLESADYFIYVANLRTVGCPERRVRDIILADVDKYYEARRAALAGQVTGDFWRTGTQRDAETAALSRQLRTLHAEQAQLVRELVGVELDDWEARKEMEEEKMFGDIVALVLGYLADGKPERVFGLLSRYKELDKELDHERRGITLPADEERQHELTKQFKAEFAELLDPAELSEMRRRIVVMDGIDSDSLVAAEMTGKEMRALADLKVAARDPLELFFDRGDGLTPEQEKGVDLQIQKLLGPARYAAYERAQDGTFKQALVATEEQNLPKAVAIQVHEINQAFIKEAQRLGADATLTEAQRVAGLDTLGDQARAAAQRVLGAAGWKDFEQRLGGWQKHVRGQLPGEPVGTPP